MSFLVGIALGFVIGLIVFERPKWATDLFARVVAKIKALIDPPEPGASL